MATMFGVIAAVAELPGSFRHIDSTGAKSTFRTLASRRPTHVSIEGARVMLASQVEVLAIELRDATALRANLGRQDHKVGLYLLQAGQVLNGGGARRFPGLQRGSHLAPANSIIR
ncbi:MAG TPA: hypothetical protein VFB99_23425, partial [Vicinamibacterales bacterium]|nr:hypothetical protein [Vicinamibacterales bacterium]